MKRIFLPLLAITAVMAVTGIEIFQVNNTDSAAAGTAEIIYVIMLAILFGLGIFLAYGRSKDLKDGLPVEDELSGKHLNRAGTISFFISLLTWLIILFLEAHEIILIESEFLFAFGLIASCFVFLISWTVINFRGAGS
jgi:peptidoglycan/LPS O-acetylase OafA/YrhL